MFTVIDDGTTFMGQSARTSKKYRAHGLWRWFRHVTLLDLLSREQNITRCRWLAGNRDYHLKQRKAGKLLVKFIMETVGCYV